MTNNYTMTYEHYTYEAKELARRAKANLEFGINNFDEKSSFRKAIAKKFLDLAVKNLAVDLEKNVSLQEKIEE